MDFSHLQFLDGMVFLEATPDPKEVAGLTTAVSHHLRFPHSGRVVKTGRCAEDIREGDIAVVEVAAEDYPSTDHRFLQITVDAPRLGDAPIWCDPEIEPILKEAMEYHEPLDITVMDTEGRMYKFSTRQIVEVQLVDFNAAEFRLSHPLRVRMLELMDAELKTHLFYIVHEREILFTIRDGAKHGD